MLKLDPVAGHHRLRKRRVCIVSPSEYEYSQTFIKSHIEQLPARVTPIYGGTASEISGKWGLGRRMLRGLFHGDFYPNRTHDGHRLVSLPGKMIDLVFDRFFGPASTPLWQRSFRRFLSCENIEAVLAEFGWTGIRVMEGCRLKGIPLIVHFHGSDAFKHKWVERYRELYKEMFQAASSIVVVSKDMREQLQRLGAPKEKLVYNPYGVDLDLFYGADPEHSSPRFLAVGRFVPKKGPHLTIKAFSRVLKRYPDARLAMIGNGELMASCRIMTRRLGIGHAVSFSGVCTHHQVAEAMRGVRALVQHSLRPPSGDSEGTPLSILEAGASGLPVVATRHAGIKDVVLHEKTGLLVDEGDVDGMAEHMAMLLDGPSFASKLGANARARIRAGYSMETSIFNLMTVIEKSIKGMKLVSIHK